MAIVIDYLSGKNRANGSAQAIGHQHEQSLRRSPHLDITLLVYEQSARHIEEVECHTIYDAREHEEYHAREGWVAHTEEAEAQHPSKHGDEHHDLDTISLEEERNQEDAQSLSHLRDGNQEGRIVGCKGVDHRWVALEAGDKRCGIAIGYLQRHTEQA